MILVTGATGTVGREVVGQLVRMGSRVRAAVHTPRKAEPLRQHELEIVPLDYDVPDTHSPAVAGADRVFFVGYAGPRFAEISARLAEAARRAGVRHFVKLSAYGADFAPEFFIAKSHRDSEEAIEATGIPFTHLRPNVFMQNLITHHSQSIKQHGTFSLGQGDGRVSFIDLRDVSAAAAAVLTQSGHEGRVYTLTGSEALSYFEAAEILSRAVGRQITYVPLSEDQVRRQAQASGRPDFLLQIGLNMDAFGRSGGFARVTGEFEGLIGRKPITFAQFARDHVRAFERDARQNGVMRGSA